MYIKKSGDLLMYTVTAPVASFSSFSSSSLLAQMGGCCEKLIYLYGAINWRDSQQVLHVKAMSKPQNRPLQNAKGSLIPPLGFKHPFCAFADGKQHQPQKKTCQSGLISFEMVFINHPVTRLIISRVKRPCVSSYPLSTKTKYTPTA